MKKILLTLLLTVFCISISADEPLKYLVVWEKDGAKTTYALKDSPQVTFADNALVVAKDGQETSFPMGNIQRFTYESVMSGDVNGDAKVDIVDVAKTINYLLTFTRSDFPEQAADINKDGTVDSDDVTAIIELVVNRIEANKPASGQQAIGEAFYIYRNDNDFNAFFRDEVEKLEFSNYDADGNLHDEVVSQLVNTADSIYCIPLTAIDSIGFVQPETIFQPNVIKMEQKGLMDYLQAVDGMSLLFSPDIPYELQPKVDDVLLYTEFENPLLEEGFVGKVKETQNNSDAFRVDCDSIYDIFDIFEQLISIEAIKDESAASRQMVDGEWISNSNSVNFNLGYSHPLSNGEVSLSGSVEGTYIATVTYNITRKEQYINVRVNHDWQYGAHLNFKASKSFGTLVGPVTELPAIRFGPLGAPIFRFQISGAPFVKGEGNMELDFSLNSPVHSYVCEAYYRNGHFAGWNHKRPVQGSNSPSFQAAFSLNGSVQVGYMVDFWLGLDISIKGIAKNFLKLGTGLDFYIGPKLSGDFSMKVGTDTPVNYYSIYKDSKIGIDWLHVDYEFFGEASLAGHKFPKAMFCNGSIQSPLNHEWYIMPEFSDLTVEKDTEKKEATISTTPSRDILFPLSVGMGLYDSEGNLLSTQYESQNYKRENEGFEVQQTFSSLESGKEYTAKPFIKILGGEVPALPAETFELEGGETSCPDANHPHMIDLGLLSGTKWACCNVGASTPEGYGGYYAWGETQTKSVYNLDTYKYYDDSNGYVNIGSDIAGTQYDAATANWGAPWRMPSSAQIKELVNNTTSVWTTQNGVSGRKFTGSNGGTIFLPAAGARWSGELYYAGDRGLYWSSTRYESYPYFAYDLYFVSGDAYWHCSDRYGGHSVRPVR